MVSRMFVTQICFYLLRPLIRSTSCTYIYIYIIMTPLCGLSSFIRSFIEVNAKLLTHIM